MRGCVQKSSGPPSIGREIGLRLASDCIVVACWRKIASRMTETDATRRVTPRPQVSRCPTANRHCGGRRSTPNGRITIKSRGANSQARQIDCGRPFAQDAPICSLVSGRSPPALRRPSEMRGHSLILTRGSATREHFAGARISVEVAISLRASADCSKIAATGVETGRRSPATVGRRRRSRVARVMTGPKA